MARMPTTTLFEAQNPTSLKERGDKSPNCPRLSWLLTLNAGEIHLSDLGAGHETRVAAVFVGFESCSGESDAAKR